MARYPWSVLGIEKTNDERAIKSAYADKLKSTRPEDDAEAFQKLVEARELALNFARRPPQTRRKSKNSGSGSGKSTVSKAYVALTDPAETIETPSLSQRESSGTSPVEIPVQDEPRQSDDNIVAPICLFLRPQAEIGGEEAASEAIDDLAAGSISQKAAVETTLLYEVADWLERQRQALEDGTSHRSGIHLYSLQKLVVVRLDMQYGWSEDFRRLSTLTPFAREITDELYFLRNGSSRDQAADIGMPIWLKIFGRFIIAYGVFALFFRILNYFEQN